VQTNGVSAKGGVLLIPPGCLCCESDAKSLAQLHGNVLERTVGLDANVGGENHGWLPVATGDKPLRIFGSLQLGHLLLREDPEREGIVPQAFHARSRGISLSCGP
jgi:hypothetical protein